MELNNIKRGFNQGYDLKRLHPELAQKLYNQFSNLSSKNEYQGAFLKGFDQAELEVPKAKSRTRHFSLSKTVNAKDDRSRDKDLGDREI